MARYLLPIIVLAVYIYGLIDCLRSDSRDVRGIPKAGWVIVIILLPLVGVILWFLLGRPRYQASARVGGMTQPPRPGLPTYARSGRSLAPDDDPDFLRNLETARRNKAEADRLRKLKEELEAREARLREQRQNGDQPNAARMSARLPSSGLPTSGPYQPAPLRPHHRPIVTKVVHFGTPDAQHLQAKRCCKAVRPGPRES